MGVSNTFDTLGRGIGPFLGGFMMNTIFNPFREPYRLDINLTLLVGFLFWVPCGIFWLFALRTVITDLTRVHSILEKRAEELKQKS